jgi:riboflavin synthase alpha subunit
MSIVDDLVANLVERNSVRLNGSLTIALVNGAITIKGTVASTLHDQNKNRDILKVNVPVDAAVRVGEIVVPVPKIP